MANEWISWGIAQPHPDEPPPVIEYGWDGVDQGDGSGDVAPWRVLESQTVNANSSGSLLISGSLFMTIM